MKLQSAMEFLTTYGWAFLIIGVVLLALYSIGAFNPNAYSAQECILNSGFSCLDFFIAPNGLLTLNLQQSTSSPINITTLDCEQSGVVAHPQKPYNPPSDQIFLPIGGNYTFYVQCYTTTGAYSGTVSSTFSGELFINYTNDFTLFPSQASGRVSLKVT